MIITNENLDSELEAGFLESKVKWGVKHIAKTAGDDETSAGLLKMW